MQRHISILRCTVVGTFVCMYRCVQPVGGLMWAETCSCDSVF